ncbi:MAG: valine--tRNA ligase [Candidatus Moranbacteria bacterium]|nr:valine--tRNA ligase [Candidatus Moranbacteria bacterium]
MQEISKTYNAADWEDRLYKQWEESGYFNPDNLIEDGVIAPDAEPFSIVLPPPNVTGNLHIGHASMLAIEDIMVRYNRMQGKRTLWLPGADHAAIATQSKVEGILHKETGLTKHDLGREAFLKKVEDFAQSSHDTIAHQVRKMGSSIDWSREAYTLDENRNLSVRKAFKQMYDDGIIYRGDRIVNWDPKMQTTVSDDEIERKEEKTKFYYFQYGPFVISTARPETKFGDKHVVVHPSDNRYKQYAHGQQIELEWINGPITATILKDEAIDMEFGSGAMTITPWHDAIDFDIAQRHGLSKEQIIDFDGKLLPIAREFAGMDIHEAREKIVEKLQAKSLVVKIEDDYIHNIAINSRGGGIIEPQIKRQWFIDVNKTFVRDGKEVSLKQLMQTAVRSGGVEIIPERFKRTYFHWIDNLRDWCISRQIWYGHRIPVWYRGEEIYCGTKAPEGAGWEQDSDTLDTWFSSGLWTFSTLGWGFDEEKWQREKIYHPTSVLETGYDILFFWVARMILMSEYFLGEVPFKKAYLHGLVRDEQGRKMSKSLGNIIDPLDIIPEHGADALRLSLVIGSTPGNDIKLGAEKIVSFHNFTNKLWNIGRYVMTQSEATDTAPKAITAADHFICLRLDSVVNEVTRHLEQYNFSIAGETLRDFTWNEFADWYVEIHKIQKNDAVLRYVFETLLKLWHPFMPFVTEALWRQLRGEGVPLLMIEKWPKDIAHTTHFSGDIAAGFGHGTQPLITAVRNIRATYHIDPVKKVTITLIAPDSDFLTSQVGIIQKLARVEAIHILKEGADAPSQCAYVLIRDIKLYVHLEGILDVEKEKIRLQKELEQTKNYTLRIETQLGNQNFVSQAPEAIILKNKEELKKAQNKAKEIESHLANLL